MLIKITEAVRARALRRPLVPAVYHDTDIRRFALIVTTERAFWAQEYQLRGVNPRTGKRYGGGTRYEIGDAVDMPSPTPARRLSRLRQLSARDAIPTASA